MIIAGIGCQRDVDTQSVLDAVSAAFAAAGRETAVLAAIAVVPAKAAESAIVDAAHQLGVDLVVVEQAVLGDVASQCLTHSARSYAATDTPSAAEAAALAAAGPYGRLLGPRIALGSVTCALAVTGGAG